MFSWFTHKKNLPIPRTYWKDTSEGGVNIKSFNNNYNINDIKDKVLKDIRENGKETEWRGKKETSILLSDSYKRLNYDKKSLRVKECGTYLEFRRYHDRSLKLNNANFCKVRLCPMCAWRRSLKIFGQVSKIMDYVTEDKDFEFIFLTLTVRNCPGDELSSTIDNLMKSFRKLTKYKKFSNSILGHFRALEVTHKLDDPNSIWYDTFHPHFHCILVVKKSYFNDTRNYISQEQWTTLWKKALNINYDPIVHVTKVRDIKGNGISKSIAEVAKYTVTPEDYIYKGEGIVKSLAEDMTDKTVKILDKSLSHRRLIAFGGILKEVHQLLNLDDTEDGDLVNTDIDDIREDLEYVIETYCWHIGYRNYVRIGG